MVQSHTYATTGNYVITVTITNMASSVTLTTSVSCSQCLYSIIRFIFVQFKLFTLFVHFVPVNWLILFLINTFGLAFGLFKN